MTITSKQSQQPRARAPARHQDCVQLHVAVDSHICPRMADVGHRASVLGVGAKNDFCGACHGTSLDVLTEGSSGLASVRFPAYRLQNSKCWRDDARIQCTACHDPHQPLSRDVASYDSRCLACHASRGTKQDAAHVGRACPTAGKDCVSCHMPKYEFPEVHHKFTDHQIRVVRAGEVMPS
jgi:hypothetical protein